MAPGPGVWAGIGDLTPISGVKSPSLWTETAVSPERVTCPWQTHGMPSSIIIIGAGPNLGQAIARRFGHEGFSVGLVSRTQSHLAMLSRWKPKGDGIRAAGAPPPTSATRKH